MNTRLAIILPMLIAFVIQLIICPKAIPVLHRLKFGQYIRNEGPKEHQKKAGTPTMGGIMILLSFTLGVVLFFCFDRELGMVMFLTLGFGVVGFLDDFLKIVKKQSEGLKVWQKFLLQCIIAAVFVAYLGFSGHKTEMSIPFTSVVWKMGWFYYFIAFFFIMAFVNGTNFTDGLDGLASGVTSVVALFLIVAAWLKGSSLTIVSSAMLGSLLGFLCFNVNPAKVFMGDTGSLALGGFVTGMTLILDIPLLLIVVGFVYVAEVLSVVLQVSYFKLTHGKRIFKMAPIHHHFELCGWKETKVVSIFVIVTVVLCMLGLMNI